MDHVVRFIFNLVSFQRIEIAFEMQLYIVSRKWRVMEFIGECWAELKVKLQSNFPLQDGNHFNIVIDFITHISSSIPLISHFVLWICNKRQKFYMWTVLGAMVTFTSGTHPLIVLWAMRNQSIRVQQHVALGCRLLPHVQMFLHQWVLQRPRILLLDFGSALVGFFLLLAVLHFHVMLVEKKDSFGHHQLSAMQFLQKKVQNFFHWECLHSTRATGTKN